MRDGTEICGKNMCVKTATIDYCTYDLFEIFEWNFIHTDSSFTFKIETDLNVKKILINPF